VGPRADVDVMAKRKILSLYWESNPDHGTLLFTNGTDSVTSVE